MTRFPDGSTEILHQKGAAPTGFAPSIWSNDTSETFATSSATTRPLVYIANSVPFPCTSGFSRAGTLEQRIGACSISDPKEAPFSDVIRCAQSLHRIREAAGLPATSRRREGACTMLPLGRQMTYAQSRTLGELLARLVIRELGDVATITRHVTRRGDKVYLDYLQNRHGQLIVAPFIVRPLPGATVSMPLVWNEVDLSLDPRTFTIRTAVDRMEKVGLDPMLPVLTDSPDLGAVLGKLAER